MNPRRKTQNLKTTSRPNIIIGGKKMYISVSRLFLSQDKNSKKIKKFKLSKIIMRTRTKTLSQHFRNWMRHTILPLIPTIMASSRILHQTTRHKKRKLFTKNALTLLCFLQYAENHKISMKRGITKIHKNVKPGIHPSKNNPMTL